MSNALARQLDSFFQLTEHKTSIRTECAAGLTTFLTMAYIIFVNPAILSEAGVPFAGAGLGAGGCVDDSFGAFDQVG